LRNLAVILNEVKNPYNFGLKVRLSAQKPLGLAYNLATLRYAQSDMS